MNRVWNGLLLLCLPYVVLRLYWRGRSNHKYRLRWRERLGHVENKITPGVDYWIHAVSVGEVNAARPLIDALLARKENCNLLLTTTTPTGSDQVMSTFGDRVQHCYAPYDLPRFVSRFLDHVTPHHVIIMETEIWPNTIRLSNAHGVRVTMANVRISDKSSIGYQRVKGFVGQTLSCVDVIAAQSERDAQRLRNLGAPYGRIFVTGSIKFDYTPAATDHEIATSIRSDWGRDRPVWIAGSTREYEEERVLMAYDKVAIEMPNLLLVIVPRHPERFDAIAQLIEMTGRKLVRRSETVNLPIPPDVQVCLGDTMGELAVLYGAADIAFVGGSLVPTGGQNVLEVSAMGKPVMFGPHTSNFREITQIIVDEDAGIRVNSVTELAEAVQALLNDADRRDAMGENGVQLIRKNRGALQRTLELIPHHE